MAIIPMFDWSFIVYALNTGLSSKIEAKLDNIDHWKCIDKIFHGGFFMRGFYSWEEQLCIWIWYNVDLPGENHCTYVEYLKIINYEWLGGHFYIVVFAVLFDHFKCTSSRSIPVHNSVVLIV